MRCVRSSGEANEKHVDRALVLDDHVERDRAGPANSTCLSVLTADQVGQLDLMLFPEHPYSAHLSEAMDNDAAQGAVKRLTKADIEKFRDAIAHPFNRPVMSVVSQERIAPLKVWLTANPSGELPAWDMAAGESDLPSDISSRDSEIRPGSRFLCRTRLALSGSRTSMSTVDGAPQAGTSFVAMR